MKKLFSWEQTSKRAKLEAILSLCHFISDLLMTFMEIKSNNLTVTQNQIAK